MRKLVYDDIHDDNYDDKNLRNLNQQIENQAINASVRPALPHFGAGVNPRISKKSRQICVESLLN